MACFLSGQAAELLGVGMQAMGLGIPVDDTSIKIMEGIRDCGLSVPPKTWFKSKNKKTLVAPKTAYSELDSKINRLIQVVKPVIVLKNIVCHKYELENRSKIKRANLLELDDIIDLTEDVPNTALKLLRSQEEEEKVLNKKTRKKQRNDKKPAVIINLDETINLDDSSNNTNMTNQIPVSKKAENKKQSLSCPICLDSLSDENVKAMSTPCGHVYCLECLKTISQTKSKCSICQRPIKFIKCIRLHI